MLFDTSSPGRKRGVQIVFAFLAILMGGGLVLFGIGTSGSGGGILDNVGNGSSSLADQARKTADKAQATLATDPKNLAAAASLAKAEVTIATQEGLDPNTGQATGKDAASQIAAADAAWTKYLALAPDKPDASTAALYAQFYILPGVGKYDKAARALEAALVTREPTAGLYAQLAFDWLVAGDKDKYQQARTKSLALASSDARKKAIASQLDDVAKQVADYEKAQAKQAAASSGALGESGGTATTPKLPTLPTLQ